MRTLAEEVLMTSLQAWRTAPAEKAIAGCRRRLRWQWARGSSPCGSGYFHDGLVSAWKWRERPAGGGWPAFHLCWHLRLPCAASGTSDGRDAARPPRSLRRSAWWWWVSTATCAIPCTWASPQVGLGCG